MLMYLLLWLARLGIGLFVGYAMTYMTRTRRRRWVDSIVGVLGSFLGGLLYEPFNIVGITDFHLGSLLPSVLGALVLLSLFRVVNRRVQPFGITKEDFENERIVVVQDDLPAEEGLRDELAADAVPGPEFIEEDLENHVRVGRTYIPAAIPLLVILLIPVLDFAFLYLRFPDISDRPPLFGTVHTHVGEAGSLDYLVYTPAGTESSALPMMVFLHGCAQDPYLLEAASGMKTLADENQFILVYPQQSNLSSPHRCWNWYSGNNQQRDSGEPALLRGIVNEVQQGYNVDPARVYVAGFSSGAAMTSILASCYPDVFAAAAIHSGMAYQSSRNEFEALLAPILGSRTPPEEAGENAYACSGQQNQPVPVLVLHGTVDKTVVQQNGLDTLAQFAQTNDFADDGSDNDSVNSEFTSGDAGQVEGGYSYSIANFEFNGEMLMQYYEVEGLDHRWSGGTGVPVLSDPKAPDAGRIIWNFFSSHSLP